jgi:hypothetical protein
MFTIAKMRNIYILPILSIIAFITNVISIIVFSQIIKNERRNNSDDLYKYLLLKSVSEMLGAFFSIFAAIFYGNQTLSYTYIMVVWFIWFQKYIINALFMASSGFEIAATFTCAISIEKKMEWCKRKVVFYAWVVFILLLSFGIEMYPIFMNVIHESVYINQFNKTIHSYTAWPNYFILQIGKFGLAESIIKEVIFLIILFSLNIYILFKLIHIRKRKRRLNTNILNIRNSNRAENRKIKMMIVLFLTFLVAHLPNVIYFGVNPGYYASPFWSHVKNFTLIFLYFTYATSIFIYFFFNNVFKRTLLTIIHLRP